MIIFPLECFNQSTRQCVDFIQKNCLNEQQYCGKCDHTYTTHARFRHNVYIVNRTNKFITTTRMGILYITARKIIIGQVFMKSLFTGNMYTHTHKNPISIQLRRKISIFTKNDDVHQVLRRFYIFTPFFVVVVVMNGIFFILQCFVFSYLGVIFILLKNCFVSIYCSMLSMIDFEEYAFHRTLFSLFLNDSVVVESHHIIPL